MLYLIDVVGRDNLGIDIFDGGTLGANEGVGLNFADFFIVGAQ